MGNPKDFQPKRAKEMEPSPALRMANTPKGDISTRKITLLITEGFDETAFTAAKNALTDAGAVPQLVATHDGTIVSDKKKKAPVDFTSFDRFAHEKQRLLEL